MVCLTLMAHQMATLKAWSTRMAYPACVVVVAVVIGLGSKNNQETGEQSPGQK
jgi:hypothetical protein